MRYGHQGGSNAQLMDRFKYTYAAGKNQLTHVDDLVASGTYAGDPDDQRPLNYGYDKLGNTIRDSSQGIASIDWLTNGKVYRITRHDTSSAPELVYGYGPTGDRIWKLVKPTDNMEDWTWTYYVRDAQGNTIATYGRKVTLRDTPVQADYPLIWEALGTARYRGLLGSVQCSQSGFVGAVQGRIDNLPTSRDSLLKTRSGLWYVLNDPGLRNIILGRYSNADLILAALTRNPKAVLDTAYLDPMLFSGSGASGKRLLEALINGNCSTVLTAIRQKQPNAFDALDATYLPLAGMPPQPPVHTSADTINGYCVFDSAALATNLSKVHNDFSSRFLLEAVASLSPTLLRDNIRYKWGYAGMGSNLRSNSDSALKWLWGWDSARFTAHLDSFATGQFKLDIYTQVQPCNMLTNAAGFVSLNNQIKAEYSANYQVSNYLNDIYNRFGKEAYVELLTEVYGQAGKVKEVLELEEHYLYGSARLGVINADTLVRWKEYDGTIDESGVALTIDSFVKDTTGYLDSSYATRYTGRKHFEITNHLGNVLAIVSDRKIPCDTPANSFKAEVIEANDYYAYGGRMEGRGKVPVDTGYRYNFNGKEEDKETRTVDFDARPFDSYHVFWWAVDPDAFKYPHSNPYAYADNNPIALNDPTGRSGEVTIIGNTMTVNATIVLYGDGVKDDLAKNVATDVQNQWNAANGKVVYQGQTYNVVFNITGQTRPTSSDADKTALKDEIANNTNYRMNYYYVGNTNQSDNNRNFDGGNTGILKTTDLKASGKNKSTTASHEMGHGWGSVKVEDGGDGEGHPDRGEDYIYQLPDNTLPGIMIPQYSKVQSNRIGIANSNGELNQHTRQANQADVDGLNLDKLNFNNGSAPLGRITNNYNGK